MQIREMIDADEQAVRSLFSICFNKDFTHEEWLWKYKRSPWGSSAAVLVNDDGVIVGHYGGIKMPFLLNGRIYEAYQFCDVMTHPAYRGRLGKRVAIVKAGEYFCSAFSMDLGFGFPSERHAILGAKKLDYLPHRYVSALVKQVGTVLFKFKVVYKVQRDWSTIDRVELDIFINRFGKKGPVILKDAQYIFWRYREHPVRQYIPFVVRRRADNSVSAFAVCAIKGDGLSIMDYFYRGSLSRDMLFGELFNTANKMGLRFISLWINSVEDDYKYFIGRGFSQETGIPYTFKNQTLIEEDIQQLLNNYNYSMGDYDAS